MGVVLYPLVTPQTQTLRLAANTAVSRSPLSGSTQVITRPGSVWEMSIGHSGLNSQKLGWIEQWLARMNGPANTCLMPVHSRALPKWSGTGAGTNRLINQMFSGDPETGDISDWSTNGTFEDWFNTGLLYELHGDGVSNASVYQDVGALGNVTGLLVLWEFYVIGVHEVGSFTPAVKVSSSGAFSGDVVASTSIGAAIDPRTPRLVSVRFNTNTSFPAYLPEYQHTSTTNRSGLSRLNLVVGGTTTSGAHTKGDVSFDIRMRGAALADYWARAGDYFEVIDIQAGSGAGATAVKADAARSLHVLHNDVRRQTDNNICNLTFSPPLRFDLAADSFIKFYRPSEMMRLTTDGFPAQSFPSPYGQFSADLVSAL